MSHSFARIKILIVVEKCCACYDCSYDFGDKVTTTMYAVF